MRKEIKTIGVVCDICETPLIKRPAYKSDGSYQASYVEIGDVDICFGCTGKLFDINL